VAKHSIYLRDWKTALVAQNIFNVLYRKYQSQQIISLFSLLTTLCLCFSL